MLDSIYQFSDLSIFFFMVVITITISLALTLLSKRFILRKLRYKDNTTIGSISALIGIIYGVLVGFIALYLINNNDHASDAVLREANAAANIYREAQWLNKPTFNNIKSELQDYINTAIKKEWPLMQKGKDVITNGDFIIIKMSNELKLYKPTISSETIILQDLLTEFKVLYNARHERLGMSGSQLTPEIWEVILIGTILIIAINYAFRVGFYLHLFAISVFAIMAASMLFLLVTLDRPFQGEFSVEPDPLQAVLDLMEKSEPASLHSLSSMK